MFGDILLAVIVGNAATVGVVVAIVALMRDEETLWALLTLLVAGIFIAALGLRALWLESPAQSAPEAQFQQP